MPAPSDLVARGQSGTVRAAWTHTAKRLACLVLIGTVACSDVPPVVSIGAPCGRNQYASGFAILPDTGVNAGREIRVSFDQHDPDLAGELSEVGIQQSWSSTSPDPEPDPRARLVSSSGQVFVDTLGTRFDQPSGGRTSRPTWYVLQWIRDAQSRNALYESFASQSLWLELWRSGASGPGTRVRVTTKESGVRPPAVCL